MGFSTAKKAVVKALREGNYVVEARAALSEKNLLAVGDIEAEEVARLVLRTSAAEYDESPHHWDNDVAVHTFRPAVEKDSWYIKAYFLDETSGTATFISVHRTM